ncbi:hypothetical protein RM549_00330 [Salegentibacter sp. F188]|uniref:Uncharacterized protein n=1 Tax=Autumnicola patrickiae TaxID=3075591 RepID=A0ABU3DXN6_9FLAO|nr:hypothetical protein [Salegentibacter sp. F188]MDT0688214.1 hypothetical protein [Salegentibacter sp. F188]
METSELKEKLIARIEGISDKNLLSDMLKFFETTSTPDELYEFSEEEFQAITIAREQIKNGEYHTPSEIDEEVKKWLKE